MNVLGAAAVDDGFLLATPYRGGVVVSHVEASLGILRRRLVAIDVVSPVFASDDHGGARLRIVKARREPEPP